MIGYMSSRPSLLQALENLAVPLSVFGGVFLIGMIGLSVLFSPGRFPVRLGERMVRFRDLQTEEQLLIARQQELLKERARVLSLTPAPTLAHIASLRAERPPVLPALVALETARREMMTAGRENIVIHGTFYDASDGRLRVEGDAFDADGGSIRMLALFVDTLRASSSFASVSEPEYREVRDGSGVVSSPFVLTLRLPDDA